jgi:hypothetical protein
VFSGFFEESTRNGIRGNFPMTSSLKLLNACQKKKIFFRNSKFFLYMSEKLKEKTTMRGRREEHNQQEPKKRDSLSHVPLMFYTRSSANHSFGVVKKHEQHHTPEKK